MQEQSNQIGEARARGLQINNFNGFVSMNLNNSGVSIDNGNTINTNQNYSRIAMYDWQNLLNDSNEIEYDSSNMTYCDVSPNRNRGLQEDRRRENSREASTETNSGYFTNTNYLERDCQGKFMDTQPLIDNFTNTLENPDSHQSNEISTSSEMSDISTVAMSSDENNNETDIRESTPISASYPFPRKQEEEKKSIEIESHGNLSQNNFESRPSMRSTTPTTALSSSRLPSNYSPPPPPGPSRRYCYPKNNSTHTHDVDNAIQYPTSPRPIFSARRRILENFGGASISRNNRRNYDPSGSTDSYNIPSARQHPTHTPCASDPSPISCPFRRSARDSRLSNLEPSSGSPFDSENTNNSSLSGMPCLRLRSPITNTLVPSLSGNTDSNTGTLQSTSHSQGSLSSNIATTLSTRVVLDRTSPSSNTSAARTSNDHKQNEEIEEAAHIPKNFRNIPRAHGNPTLTISSAQSDQSSLQTNPIKIEVSKQEEGGKLSKNVPSLKCKIESPEKRVVEASTCCICLFDIKPADLTKLDKCKHTYCFDCIEKWAEQENKCPQCKVRFSKIERVQKIALGKRKYRGAVGLDSPSGHPVKNVKKIKHRDQRAIHNMISNITDTANVPSALAAMFLDRGFDRLDHLDLFRPPSRQHGIGNRVQNSTAYVRAQRSSGSRTRLSENHNSVRRTCPLDNPHERQPQPVDGSAPENTPFFHFNSHARESNRDQIQDSPDYVEVVGNAGRTNPFIHSIFPHGVPLSREIPQSHRSNHQHVGSTGIGSRRIMDPDNSVPFQTSVHSPQTEWQHQPHPTLDRQLDVSSLEDFNALLQRINRRTTNSFERFQYSSPPDSSVRPATIASPLAGRAGSSLYHTLRGIDDSALRNSRGVNASFSRSNSVAQSHDLNIIRGSMRCEGSYTRQGRDNSLDAMARLDWARQSACVFGNRNIFNANINNDGIRNTWPSSYPHLSQDQYNSSEVYLGPATASRSFALNWHDLEAGTSDAPLEIVDSDSDDNDDDFVEIVTMINGG